MHSIRTILAVLPCLPSIAAAQDETLPDEPVDIGSTLVTARKFEERIEDVPAAVTVVPGADLENEHSLMVNDLTGRIPNMRFTEFSSRRLSFPYVRGIGSGIGEPAVVTYVDGVPQLAVGSSNMPLVGLDRVEVLRGPQGTLYGRNALGGVIHLFTERPGETAESDVGVGFGNYGLEEYSASYSGPLGGGTGLSVTGMYSIREGYTENDFTGNDVDDREAFFGRAQFVMNPTVDSELRIGLYGEHANDGGFVLAPLDVLKDRPHHIDQDFEGVAQRDLVSPTLTYTFFGQDVEVTSVTAYNDWDIRETSDFDFTNIDGVRRDTREDQEYFYQEVRVASSPDQEGTRWLVGASGFLADTDRSAENDFRPDGAGVFFPPAQVGVDTNKGDFDDTAYGIFGQVAVPVGERWELAAGVRYDREDKEADLNHTFVTGGFTVVDEDNDFDDDFDEFTPMVSAAFDVTESTTTYARIAKAFKAGGYNLTAPANDFFFDTEESWTYEVGVKSEVTERIDVKVAVFFVDWDDMQLSLFDPAAGGYIDNAGESTSQGVELELDAEINDQWSSFLTFGLVDTEFDEFIDSFGMDDSGNDLTYAPEETWSLGLRYSTEIREGLRLYARGEYVGVGDFYYDPSNLEEESYDLVNFSAGIQSGDWNLGVWVRNAFDEEYFPVAFQINPADATAFIAESGAPRTYGATLRFSF